MLMYFVVLLLFVRFNAKISSTQFWSRFDRKPIVLDCDIDHNSSFLFPFETSLEF